MRSRSSSFVLILLAAVLSCDNVGAAQSKSDPPYFESGAMGVGLLDSKTGASFVGANGDGTTADDGLVHHFYENAAGTEALDLIRHPGTEQNAFAQIRIMQREALPLGAPPVSVKGFISSKGVRLGIGTSDLQKLLGKPNSVKSLGSGRTAYVYRCEDARVCPSLTHYNLPTYSATATFTSGHLTQYTFGFDYP